MLCFKPSELKDTWLSKHLACNAFGLVWGSFSASLRMISSTLHHNTKFIYIEKVAHKQFQGIITNKLLPPANENYINLLTKE